MKKLTLFCAVVLLLSGFSVGCSSDGSSSWCRSGSLFPTTQSRKNHEVVYTTSALGSQCDPCAEVSPCNPCEPVCNPCDMSCSGVYGSGITQSPHPL